MPFKLTVHCLVCLSIDSRAKSVQVSASHYAPVAVAMMNVRIVRIGSPILVSCLAIILAAWRYSEGTLSVNNIRTTKAETFYWTAILFSNTLGTALGDFLADSSGLGFLGGAILIGALLAVIVLAYYFTTLSRILLFWMAFVLTRPFGATFGDVLTKPIEKGGLNLGTIGSSMVLAAILVTFVVITTIQEKRVLEGQRHTGPLPSARKRERLELEPVRD